MTELVQHVPSNELSQQMEYARVVSASDLLPQAYKGKPANVLIAVGLGQAMGLSPAESMWRIDVIQGKPTASAELIASNVRRAGHLLRVRVDEAAMTVTATIVRSDDPDYEHTVVRDMAWAKRMGLDTKDNYKKQPTTMLQWRAISAVARMACPEALYGVAYTPDEIDDQPSAPSAPAVSVASFSAAPVVTTTEPHATSEDVQDAEVVPDEPQPEPKITPAQQRKLFALFKAKGIPESEQASGIAHVIKREVTSRTAMTDAEFEDVIAVLNQQPDALNQDAAEKAAEGGQA